MWKIIVAFILFAALALFVISRSGDVDMGGEKHGIDSSHSAPPAASAASH